MDLNTPASFPDSLGILGWGMVGIFVVTAAIILTIVLLNVLTGSSKKKKQSGEDA